MRHELIGLQVKVVKSSHEDHVGIEGTVVDETMNTLIVRSTRGDKMVPKAVTTLTFTLPDGTKVEVEGKYLRGRPWDRVKRVPRRLW